VTKDLSMLFALVDAQAEDEGLWFFAETAAEAYLQAALRDLHEAVERCDDRRHIHSNVKSPKEG
jgi:hypothetical protein